MVTAGRIGAVSRPAVLVVDDNDLVLKVVTQFLSARGVYVMTTSQPSIGKELADGVENLVAVVLDVDMPEIDGGALSEALRAHPKHEKVPIIFYSGLRKFRTDALLEKVSHSSVVSKTNGVEALWNEIQRVAPHVTNEVEEPPAAPPSKRSEPADDFELDQIFDGLIDAPKDPSSRATIRPQNPGSDVVFEKREDEDQTDDVYTRATVRPPADDKEGS